MYNIVLVFIINFQQNSHIALIFLLLTLNNEISF